HPLLPPAIAQLPSVKQPGGIRRFGLFVIFCGFFCWSAGGNRFCQVGGERRVLIGLTVIEGAQREIVAAAEQKRGLPHAAAAEGPAIHARRHKRRYIADADMAVARLAAIAVGITAQALFEVITKHGSAQLFGDERLLARSASTQ